MSHLEARRLCDWCRGPIPPGKRRDAATCSKACRQAKHRFRVGPAPRADGPPIRVAYADPPYPGKAHYYPEGQEIDHRELVERLVREFPDGWALSTSAEALPHVLRLCPLDVRVAAWVRPPRGGAAWGPRNSWEPVIYRGGRRRHV